MEGHVHLNEEGTGTAGRGWDDRIAKAAASAVDESASSLEGGDGRHMRRAAGAGRDVVTAPPVLELSLSTRPSPKGAVSSRREARTCTPMKNLTVPSLSFMGASVNMFQNGLPLRL